MEELNKKIPFPQANDFNKIITILESKQEVLKDREMIQELIEVGSNRQVLYYLSACQFLGLIDENDNFTEIAMDIKSYCYENKITALSSLIISKPVFGEVFFKKYFYGEDANTEEIAQLISDLWGTESYSVCLRRASTVKKWLEWIDSNKE